MKHSILCVDDEIHNAEALERIFRKKYQVFTATSGKDGLKILKDHNCSLIITDQRMPKMSGVEFLQQTIKICPHTIRILLTGFTDIDAVIGAINSGEVYRYITKPWDPIDLKNTVDKAIEKYELREELAQRNKELENALNELKTLDASKNQFMVLINHELKTPLTVLLSFLDLLNETTLTQDQSLYLSKIQKSGNQLQQIIEEVLQFVKAETGQLSIKYSKIKFNELVAGIEKPFFKLITDKSLELCIQSSDITLKLDSNLITKVIYHLLKNALSFANPKSKIHLTSGLIQINENTSAFQFKISNEAPTIPNKTLLSLLKPFNLNENILNHSKGMGIGLSLCQALLKTHSSELIITSKNNIFEASFTLTHR